MATTISHVRQWCACISDGGAVGVNQALQIIQLTASCVCVCRCIVYIGVMSLQQVFAMI